MIFITGASGFVGKSLVDNLKRKNIEHKVGLRNSAVSISSTEKEFVIGDISETTDWSFALHKVEVVIHLAARVHVMDDKRNSLTEFRNVNTYATLKLAKQAVQAGVKRFIFISSVKVNGEMTTLNRAFTPDDQYIPDDPYGLSKYEAEQGLLLLAKETDMEVVIIRPPLVYGPGVRANFASMMKWINRGVPLPLGAINNHRSLIALDNLVSFIIHCIDHPKAANEVFLISDTHDVSTTELLQKVAKAFDKKVWLIPMPVSLMTYFARLIGKGDISSRLFASLQIDSSKACELLDWKPVITMDQQLKKSADAYLNNEKTI
ncbi:MAG: SDR family oxidoreductase [Oceanospirillaceae bacterium]